MLAILFALISYISYGSADIFGTIASRKLDGYSMTFWSDFLSFVALNLLLPFFWTDFNRLTIILFFFTFFVSIIGSIAQVSIYKGFSSGNASIVGTIAGSYVALVILLSIIFLHEKITGFETVAVLLIIVGIILASFKYNKKSIFSDKGVKYGFIAMIGWGIYFTFIKISINYLGWFLTTYISYLTFFFIFGFIKANKLSLQTPKIFSQTSMMVLFSTALLLIGSISYYIGIGLGKVTIVAPISGSYPTLFVLLSFIFLKGKLAKQQITGIVITLVGIVLLSFLSSQ